MLPTLYRLKPGAIRADYNKQKCICNNILCVNHLFNCDMLKPYFSHTVSLLSAEKLTLSHAILSMRTDIKILQILIREIHACPVALYI